MTCVQSWLPASGRLAALENARPAGPRGCAVGTVAGTLVPAFPLLPEEEGIQQLSPLLLTQGRSICERQAPLSPFHRGGRCCLERSLINHSHAASRAFELGLSASLMAPWAGAISCPLWVPSRGLLRVVGCARLQSLGLRSSRENQGARRPGLGQ